MNWQRTNTVVWLSLLMVICAVAWLLPLSTVDDDMAYRFMVGPDPQSRAFGYMDCNGDLITTLSDSFKSALNHWLYVNGRLSDKLFIIGILLPVWLANVLIGIAIGLMPLIICGAAAQWRQPGALMLAAILMWFCLPWTTLGGERAYLLNYAVAGECLMSMIWLTRIPRFNGLLFLLTFITGWMHEIFGIVALVWLFVYWLTYRHERRILVAFICCGAGLILVFCSPGLWLRWHQENVAFSFDELGVHLSRLSVGLLPMLLALILAIVALLRSRISWRECVPWLFALGCSAAIALYFISGGRFLWAVNVISIALIIALIKRLFPQFYAFLSSRYIVCCFAVMYVLWTVQLAKAQRQVSDSQLMATDYLTNNHKNVVPILWPDEYNFPWYVAAIVENPSIRTGNFAYVDGYAAGLQTDAVYVNPELENKDFNDWPKLPGNNPIRGTGGNYYVADSCANYVYMVTFGEYTAASSPVDRLLGLLRGSNTSNGGYQATCQGWVGDKMIVRGDTLRRFYFGDFRRGLASRRIVSVDRIHY